MAAEKAGTTDEEDTARAAVVQQGDWVKVSRNSERFWCRVVKPCDGGGTSLTVVADNNLLKSNVRCFLFATKG